MMNVRVNPKNSHYKDKKYFPIFCFLFCFCYPDDLMVLTKITVITIS